MHLSARPVCFSVQPDVVLTGSERGIYIALSGKRRYGILCTGLLAGILPIYGIGMLCNGITYGTATLLQVTLVSLLAYLLSLVLSVFIKKAGHLPSGSRCFY